MNKPEFYLATVLLEKNRWGSKVPTIRVSEWAPQIAEAGFDGVELWENHLLLADESEREALRNGPVPVAILNTYCGFDAEGAEARARSAELARLLDVQGVKFNLGRDAGAVPKYLENLEAWASVLPDKCRLLCECHPGTVLEDPSVTARLFEPVNLPVEIIVHALHGDDDRALQAWLGAFGDAVTHVHAVIRDRGIARRRVQTLRDTGFSGTWTIEFCDGVYSGEEDVGRLLAQARDDLHFLREELA